MKFTLFSAVLCLVAAAPQIRSQSPHEVLQDSVPRLPVSFVENAGQIHSSARFVARCGKTTAFFTESGFVLRLVANSGDGGPPASEFAGAHVFLSFEEAQDDVVLRGTGRGLAPVRSYRGNDPSAWVTEAASWSSIRYDGLYPGVDVAVLERNGSLAYDLLLAPGADPAQVVLRCEGVTGLALDGEQLVLSTAVGPLVQTPPVAWQVGALGERFPVEVSFRLIDGERYGFSAPDLSPELPLVIDPGLTWATDLGGTFADSITTIVRAPDGDLLITGSTGSPDFPTTPGPFQNQVDGFSDVFLTRLDPVGNQLRFSTFMGGTDTVIFRPEVGEDLALAADGSIVVVGTATSPNFPTTTGVLEEDLIGGADAFVARFDGDGMLLWSTRFGGTKNDAGSAVGVSPDGSVILAGHTFSNNLPVTSGAFDESFNSLFLSNDIFVSRLASDGSAVIWCTYVGGSLRDEVREILLNGDGSVTLGGLSGSINFPVTAGAYDESYNGPSGTETDGVLLRLSADGATLGFSTFLGGPAITEICGLAETSAGDLVVAGTTFGGGFPTTTGARQLTYGGGFTDGFVARLSGDASTLQWSTYFGGQGDDSILSLALDSGEQPTVTGETSSTSLFHDLAPEFSGPGFGFGGSVSGSASSGPAGTVTTGGFGLGDSPGQGSDLSLDGAADAWLGRLSTDGGSLVWGSYYGGSMSEEGATVVLDAFGDAWIAGRSDSSDLPTTVSVDTTNNGGFVGFLAHFSVPPLFQLGLDVAGMSGLAENGKPPVRLEMTGSFVPGTPWSLSVSGGEPGLPVLLVLGSGAIQPQVAGGRSFVNPIDVVLSLTADAEGLCLLSGDRWPLTAQRLVLQAWAPGEPAQGSNGLLLMSP
ncbi:MAG: hypothetical protein ACI9EF_001624 [Pseudohongiellaceae bacterium]|jgi:hypothetical protein